MKSPKILIVENESIAAEDLKIRLEYLDYTVTATAPSGEEALRV